MVTTNTTPLAPPSVPPDELQRLVEQYKVVYAVYPEWGPDEKWEQHKVGFDLELVGTHFKPLHPPSPGCPECQEVYEALHQIADFILPKAERMSRYTIDRFDGTLVSSPRRNFRQDVRLTIRIVHREDYRGPIDECESTCLAEMEASLSALGSRRG